VRHLEAHGLADFDDGRFYMVADRGERLPVVRQSAGHPKQMLLAT